MKKILFILLVLVVNIFAQTAPIGVDFDKDLVFREVFQDEQTLRKNLGAPTDIASYNPAVFNGTSSRITRPMNLNGTYSVRMKVIPNLLTGNRQLFEARKDGGTGVIYSNGTTLSTLPSSTKYINGSLGSTLTVNEENDCIVTGLNISTVAEVFIGMYYGASSFYSGSISLIEIYSGTLSANQVDSLYQGTYASTYPRPPVNNFWVSDEMLGDELITDGEFNTAIGDGNWTVQDNWIISGGTANYDGLASPRYLAQASVSITTGTKYVVTFDVLDKVTLLFTNELGSTMFAGDYAVYDVGSHTITENAVVTGSLRIYGNNTSGAGIIDNLSIQELIREAAPTHYRESITGFNTPKATSKIETGLVASYNMEAGSGQVLVDISGNGNNGTNYNTTSTYDAMVFNGTSSYVSADNDITSYPFTVNAKFFIASKTNSNYIVTIADENVGTRYIYFYSLASTSQLYIGRRNAATHYTTPTGYILNTDIDYVVDVVYNSSTSVNVYVNGDSAYANSSLDAVTITSDFDKVVFGNRSLATPGSYFDGSIAEVNIYSKALTETEIVAKYNETIKPVIVENFDYSSDAELNRNWITLSGVFTVSGDTLIASTGGDIRTNVNTFNYVNNGYVTYDLYSSGSWTSVSEYVSTSSVFASIGTYGLTITLITGEKIRSIVIKTGLEL